MSAVAGRSPLPCCRSCGHDGLHEIIDLGRVPLANALLTAEQLDEPEERFPLQLYFCPRCTLVQIGVTVPPERLFHDYPYASSFSDTMLAHSRALVEALIARRAPRLVVEIASNDGYLLQFYRQRGVAVLGIEPAANIARIAVKERGIPTLVEFFDQRLAAKLAAEGQAADIIHAHNVLAHVPDPNEVAAGIAALLAPGGIAVIEVPYVGDLVSHLEFDTIYHEHFSYFSLSAVDALFRRHGLAVVDVERVSIHGGSLQLSIARAGEAASARVAGLSAAEAALRGFDYYRDFATRVTRLRGELLALLQRLVQEGRQVAAYGASAKGSTLMNAFGIDRRLIGYVVDRSSLKQGRFTPGNHLPILPPEALLERRPDHVLLLTWNFADEILAQQAEFRRRGGRFIIPVPEVRVV